MANDTLSYETYHGLHGRSGPALVLCLGMVIWALVGRWPAPLRIADLVSFGGTGILLGVHAFSGRIALRADASGVTLGGTVLRYRATTRFMPWDSIERIVVWQRWMPRGGPLLYIGLAGPADAPPAGRRAARVAARANAFAAPPVPGGVYLGIRAVTGWQLDLARLAAVTAHFAPSVRIETPSRS